MIPSRSRRAVALASAAGVLAVGLTVAVVSTDTRIVAGHSYGQVALDSMAATVGLLLAYLVYGRFTMSRSQSDALLCAALMVLSGANAVFAVLPLVQGMPGRLTTASALAGMWAAVLFAAAVWLSPQAVEDVPRRVVPAALGLLVVLVLLSSWSLSELLPRDAAGSADTFGATSDLFLTGAQVLAACGFLIAAAGWCRPSLQDDSVARLLAVASVFGGLSRLDFAAASEAGSSWVTAGTALRIAFYLTLVATSVVEIRGYWRRVADVAVLEERRRIARNLHDGLAQELAFTATQARALAERSEHPTRAHLIAAAAERALDESRRAIAALTRPLDEPLDVAVAQCAEEICGRFHAALVLDVQGGVSASGDVREAVLRILREAVSNALRHGSATSVTVRLSGDGPLRLRVEDDGEGFDPTDKRHLSGRFGLISMRERAEALGGTFDLSSRSPGGTTVEVLLPCR